MGDLRSRHLNGCLRCPLIENENTPEEEYYELLSLRFNLRIVRELSRGHDSVRVERMALEEWLKEVRIDGEHLRHIPLDLGPGIMATLPSGCGMPLIDGNHRAARALRDGSEFFVFVLSERETLELLRRSMGRFLADYYWNRMLDSMPHPDDAQRGDW
jgi:hypothetical protein